jgi:hypothetical protein
MSRAFPLAGFEVTINGRIWVIPEAVCVRSSWNKRTFLERQGALFCLEF